MELVLALAVFALVIRYLRSLEVPVQWAFGLSVLAALVAYPAIAAIINVLVATALFSNVCLPISIPLIMVFAMVGGVMIGRKMSSFGGRHLF